MPRRKRASSGQVSEPRSTGPSPHAATGLRATWMRVRVCGSRLRVSGQRLC